MSVITTLLAHCKDQGVQHVGIAPGSRSSQLVHALLDADFSKITTHIDERSLAFWALGIAKASGRPAVICCSSGTAVANLLPAVVEAAESETPMIILTADRSLNEKGCASNQTIQSQELSSDYLSAFLELDVSDNSEDTQSLIKHTFDALHGPIQINLRLPDPNPSIFNSIRTDSPIHSLSSRPELTLSTDAEFASAQECIESAKTGVIVVGNGANQYQSEILSLAQSWGWPIIADVQSSFRTLEHPLVLSHAELLLVNHDWPAPDCILWISERLVSKRLLSWVAQASVVQISESRHRSDAGVGGVQRLVAPLADALARAATWAVRTPPTPTNTLEISTRHQQRRDQMLELTDTIGWSEPWVHLQLNERLKSGAPYMIGNSMSIRLANLVLQSHQSGGPTVYANRGASGIDGLISTAIGISESSGQTTTIVLGDMSFAYDVNALLMCRQLKVPLHIIVMNNGGGDIFRQLPQAEETSNEQYWVQDTALKIQSAAEMASLAYCKVESIEHWNELTLDPSQSMVIEVVVDPSKTRDWFSKLGV